MYVVGAKRQPHIRLAFFIVVCLCGIVPCFELYRGSQNAS